MKSKLIHFEKIIKMNKILKYAVLIIIFNPFACVINAQVKWDYPVKPGTEEWKNFQSNEEMVKACQIPEKVLSSLPTEELTELCLQYPLIFDVFAFNNLNNGLDKLFSDFNGIRVLFQRNDVLNCITKRYIQKIQSLSFLDGKSTEYDKGDFIVNVSLLEVLLSRCTMQNDTASEVYKDILRILVSGYENKFEYADYFKGVGFRSNVYSRAQVISKMDKQNLEKLSQKDKNYALFSGMADEQSIRVIDELSYQLIK